MPNVYDPEWEAELVSGDMVLRAARVGAAAGGSRLGAALYELEPHAAISPMHVHHANEEMLLVLSGVATVRTPDGEHQLEAGELRAFPAGPTGAHRVENRSAAPTRVLIVSTMVSPDVVEHPDSGKILTMVGQGPDAAAHAFRTEDEVPPWAGELDEPPRPVDP